MFQDILFLMRPAWLRSLLVGSVRSDSSEKRFGRKLVFTSSSIITLIIIIIILNWTTWTLGLVESDSKVLSTMVSATLAILDFSSAEEPWRKELRIKIYQEKEGADLRGPCENWFLVHVQQYECVLVVQAGHLFGHWNNDHKEDDDDNDDFHRLINLVRPHKRLLGSDWVALGLHPSFKYLVMLWSSSWWAHWKWYKRSW